MRALEARTPGRTTVSKSWSPDAEAEDHPCIGQSVRRRSLLVAGGKTIWDVESVARLGNRFQKKDARQGPVAFHLSRTLSL